MKRFLLIVLFALSVCVLNAQTITTNTIVGSPFCAGATGINVMFSISGTYSVGNTFTAQLSDGTGNFIAPTAIGSISSTTAVTIMANIPGGTAVGTNYRIRVVSSNPVITGSDNGVGLMINPTPTPPATSSNSPVCSGQNLNLNATSTGGSTYSWTGPNTFSSSSQSPILSSVSTMATGTYSVHATYNGCVGNTATINVTVNQTPASPTAGNNSPFCEGNNLSLTASGSAGTYSWTGPNAFSSSSQNPMINNAMTAASGTYFVSNTVNGCPSASGTTNVSINQTPFTPSVSSNSPVNAGNNLNLFANSSGATIYNWSGPNTFTSSAQNPVISGVTTNAAGSYSVTATSAGGCVSPVGVTSVSVNPPGAFSIPTTQNNVSCYGGNNGSATANPSSIYPPYTYSWSNGQTSQTASGLMSGNYSVTVTDGVSATAMTSVSITQPGPFYVMINGNNNICPGQNTTLSASTSGGTPSYSYSWNTGSTFQTITVSPSVTTTYSVNVIDLNGCAAQMNDSVKVSNLSTPFASSNSPVTVGGTLNLNASFVSGAMNYYWNGPNGFNSTGQNPMLSNVTTSAAGSYSVYAMSSSGCASPTSVTSVSVGAPGAFPLSINKMDITCFGMTNGSATANPSGPNPPFTYSWSNGASTQSISNLAVGNYSVTVSDATAATAMTSVSIYQPPSLTNPYASSNTPVYAGSTLNLFANFVSGANTYNWSGPNSFTSTMQNPSINNVTTSATGTYSVYAMNANGCTSMTEMTSVTINSAGAFPLTINKMDITCSGFNNGSATAVPSGGTAPYTYSWNNGATTQSISSLYQGNYSITVTDATTATSINTVSIMQPSPVYVSIMGNNNICPGQSTTLSASANGGNSPYSYSWNTGATFQNIMVSPSVTTTYSVTVHDMNGCVAQMNDSVKVSNLSAPSVSNNSPVMAGGNLNLYAGYVPGAAYNWNGPNAFFAGMQNPVLTNVNTAAAGSYSVSINVNGCNSPVAVTSVTVNPSGAFPLSINKMDITCFGMNNGSATANPSSPNTPFTFLWSNGATTQSISNLSQGNYTVSVTDNSSATATAVAFIMNPAPLSNPSPSSNSPVTAGGTLNLNASFISGATIYNWSGPSFTSSVQNPIISNVTSANAGTYSVTATTASGCVSPVGVTSVSVMPPGAFPVSINKMDISCYGLTNGSATANPSGPNPPFTYSWSNGQSTQTISGLAVGNYTVTVADATTATAMSSVSIYQPGMLTPPNPTSNSPVVSGSSLNLSAFVTGATIYNWSGPSFTSNVQNPVIANVTSANAGSYSVTATTASGCVSPVGVTSVTVNSAGAFTVNLNKTDVTCYGMCNGSINVNPTSGTPPYTYMWTPGGQSFASISGLCPGNYSVTITDANTNTSMTSALINQPSPFFANVFGNNHICPGQSTTLSASLTGGTPSFSFSWNNGSSTQNIVVSPTALTIYSVTVTDINGCTSQNKDSVSVNPIPTPTVTSNSPVSVGSVLNLYVNVPGATMYNWSGPSFTSSVQNPMIANVTSANAGTYSVYAMNGNGCSSSVGTVSVSVNPSSSPVAAFTASSMTVCPNSPVNFTDNSTGGATSWYWNFGDGNTSVVQNPSHSFITNGNYSVKLKVTNAGGADSIIHVIVASPAACGGGLSVTISKTDILCFGQSNGSATANATGGTGAFTYLWNTSPTQTTQTATSLAQGNYSVTVTDALGISATAVAAVAQPSSSINATISGSAQGCAGQNVTLSSSVTGGTGAYSYVWSPGGQNVANIVVAPTSNSTSYSVMVTDANGCTQQPSYIIYLYTTPPAPTLSSNSPIASGQTLSLTASAGGMTYSWSGPNGFTSSLQNPTITGATIAASGTYSATLTDMCTSPVSTISVTVNAPLTVSVSTTNISCNGGNNGSVTATVFGGNSPYVYSWNTTPVQTTQTITGLTAGNYSVTVTDAASTIATSVAVITQPIALTVSIGGNTTVCSGKNSTLTATVSGGVPAYTYQWSPFCTYSDTVTTPTSSTTYSVLVTDNVGCSKTGTVSVIVNPTPSSPTASSNSPVIAGQNLSLTASSTGTTYNWSGPNSFTSTTQNPVITGVTTAASGTYSVYATNAGGCVSAVATTAVTINPAPSVSVTVSTTSVTCNGGSNGHATATGSGGTGTLTYLWSNAANTQVISNLAAANYSVTVTDALGISATSIATIAQPAVVTAPTAGSNSPVTAGQVLNLTASTVAGTTYSWSGPNSYVSSTQNPVITAATTAASGTYSVIATNANGCSSAAATTTVTVNTAPSVSVTVSTTSVTCNGGNDGSATATASGGTGTLTYLWSNSANTSAISNLAIGSYSITVTDALGITATSVATISQPAVVTAPTAGSNSPVTAGQNLSLTASTVAGTTYSWSGPNSYTSASQNPVIASVTTVAAGTYSVIVTNTNGCSSAAATTVVTINPIPSVSVTVSTTSVTCNGGNNGSATANAISGSAPYTYLWSPGGQVAPAATGLTAGNYTVTVTDNMGSKATQVATVTQPAIPLAPTASSNSPIFIGATLSLTANSSDGSTIYQWNGPNAFNSTSQNPTIASATSAATGTYSVFTTNPNGCKSVVGTVVVAVNDPGFVSVAPTTTKITCIGGNNGSASANASNGTPPYTYSWTPGGQTTSSVTGLSAGNYIVTVKDANSVVGTGTAVVTQPAALLANVVETNPIKCHGICNGIVSANPTGGTKPYVYLWNASSATTQSISNLCPGTYSVAITDSCGTNAYGSITIVEPGVFSVSTTKTDLSCNGQCSGTASATTVGGTSPFTYYWSDGQNAQIAIGLCVGKYNVFVTDNHGCIAIDTTTLSQPLAIPISITTAPPTCGAINGSATAVITGAGAIPPFKVLWNTGDTSFTINNLAAGIYRANVKDGNGCVSFSEALMNNSNGPTVTVSTVKDVSCFGLPDGSIDISVVGSGPYKYKWSNGLTTQNISNLSFGPYEVEVSDASACSVTKSVFVNQPSAPLSSTTSSVKSSCPGANGSTSVYVMGGTTPYTYNWSSGSNAATTNGLSAANYSVTVTDAHGCTILDVVAVSDSIGPVVIADTIPAVDCGSTGFVMLTPKDSTNIQGYQWNTGSTTQNLSNVTPGNYGVVVTDLTGCKSSLVVPVKPALPPLKPICLVTVDTLTQLNLIVWEKPLSAFIDGFNIYRESSQNGIYQKVGYVPYGHLSTFYDSITNPNDRWAKYKISMNDVCGKEGPFSPEHKTIHFSIQSSSTTDKTYLIWDEYIGSSFSYYHIFRKAKTHGAWTLIDSVPSTVTTYCDSLFPHLGDTLFYLIDVSHGDCNATIKGGPVPNATTVKGSKSNSSERLTNNTSAIGEFTFDNTLAVYPNPSSGTFTVQSSRSKLQSLRVYNVLGELVYQTRVNNSSKTEVTIPGISNGLYQIHIVTDKGETNTKILIAR